MNRARHRSRLAAVAATLLVAVGCPASGPAEPAAGRRRHRPAAAAGRRPRHQPARRVPCTTGLLAETALGLLTWTEPAAGSQQQTLLEPGTGRVATRYPEVHGVVGDLVLWGGHERNAGPLTLTDRRTGTGHPVARPTPHGWAGLGLASPDYAGSDSFVPWPAA